MESVFLDAAYRGAIVSPQLGSEPDTDTPESDGILLAIPGNPAGIFLGIPQVS